MKLERGTIIKWWDDHGEAQDQEGRKVFIHLNQFCIRDGPFWRQGGSPPKNIKGRGIVFVAREGRKVREATNWALT